MFFRFVTVAIVCLATIGSARADDIGWVAVDSRAEADGLTGIVGSAYARQGNSFLISVNPKSHLALEDVGLTFAPLIENTSVDVLYLVVPPDRPSVLSTRLDRLGVSYDIGGGVKVMSLSPLMARSLSADGEHSAISLTESAVRTSYKAPAAKGLSITEESFPTDVLANLINQDSLHKFVTRFEAFQTRYVLTDSIDAARDWAAQKFRDFGYTDVSTPEFTWSNTTQYNVMAVKQGYAEPDKVIVVGAHYDSVVREASPGRLVFAPGADDNGSGSAAVLELARVLADVPLRKTVIFMLFSAEEVGLIGSRAAARQFVADGVDVEVMYNYDMIAHMSDGLWGVDIISGTNFWYRLLTIDAAKRVTPLDATAIPVTTGSSDHASFTSEGFDVVYSVEGDFNFIGWHTSLDVSNRLHFGFMTEVVRMGLASLAIAANAGHPTTVTRIIDQGDGASLEVFWDACDPTYSYMLRYGPGPGNYSDSVLASWQTCSHLVTNLTEGQPFYFSVVGTPSDGYPAVWAGEGSLQPLIEPRKPVGLDARPALHSIELDWADNPEADLAGYRIYRETDGGVRQLVADNVTQASFVDSSVLGATMYRYQVTAIDATNYESDLSDVAVSVAGTFDRGILLVDEITRGSIEPLQAAQESWFDVLFDPTPYTLRTVDAIPDALGLVDAAPYSSIFWIDDDLSGKYIDKSDETLRWYSTFEANLFVAGYRTVEFWSAPSVPSDHLLRTDFGVVSYTKNPVEDFAGGTGAAGWPSVIAAGSQLFQNLPAVVVFEPDSNAQVIYTYDSFGGDPSFEGKPCGLLTETEQGKRIVLGFPLLYLDTASARALMQHAVVVFGEEIELVQAGDLNGDSEMDIFDAMAIVGYLFGDVPKPSPAGLADVDGSCRIDFFDLVYFVDFLFNNGSPPQLGCAR